MKLKRVPGLKNRLESKIWRHKYNPKTIDQYLATESFKNRINSWTDGTNDSHLLFESSLPGTGKSSLAMIIALSTSDAIGGIERINASKDGTIDVVRNRIFNFIIGRSPSGRRKTIILDEFERMGIGSIKAILDMIDEYSHKVRFIATCNDLSQITNKEIRDAFEDRFEHVDFKDVNDVSSDERKQLAKDTLKFCEYVLNDNNVKYDRKAVVEIIKDNICGPIVRFRKIINTLYKYNGRELTLDSLKLNDELQLTEILEAANAMDFKTVRSFVELNKNNAIGIIKEMYENIGEYFDLENEAFPQVFLILNEYEQYVLKSEIKSVPLTALFVELSNLKVIL